MSTPATRRASAWFALVGVGLVCIASPAAGQGVLDHVRSEKGVAWLLGALHFGTSDLYPLAERTERAFAASDRLMVEVNLLGLDRERVSEVLQRLGHYPGDEALRQHIPEHLWQRLVRTAQALDLRVRDLDRQRPWLVELTITSAFLERNDLYASQGVDRHFLRRARRLGLPTLELEGFETQLGLFEDIPLPQQVWLLDDTLTQVEAGRSVPLTLLEAWRTGDRKTLAALLVDRLAAKPAGRALLRRLLDERNERMATRIAAELERGGTVFVVVGAAHLLGEGSVSEHLRARGYAVSAR